MSFWSKFEQASCYPDKCQCEATRDAFIRQPSAFWSSLAYIVAGVALYRHVQKKSLELKFWAGVCVLMGLTSMFGHASFIRFSLAFDFASIILVLSFFALLNFLELLKQSAKKILLFFSIYYLFLFFIMYSMDKWVKIGTCLLVFAFAIGDVIRDVGWKFLGEKELQISLSLLLVSFGFFIIDERHIACDPFSLFQWHSLWHIGSAGAMYFYGKWRLGSV